MLVDYDKVINLIARQLDERAVRGELIASNIANVDTPGYKAKDLQFKDALAEKMGSIELKTTNPKHLSDNVRGANVGQISENPNPGRPDGNNVDINNEIMKLTTNSLQYVGRVQLLGRRLGQIKNAIVQIK
jgi:flagellar basal-body rod protein FlgB